MPLVRALIGDQQVNVSPEYAESQRLELLLDEPTHNPDGSVRESTRSNGRPIKPKTTAADAAAKKQAAQPSAETPEESK